MTIKLDATSLERAYSVSFTGSIEQVIRVYLESLREKLGTRELFNAWCKSNKPYLMGDWDGKPYVDYNKTELAWRAWQGALSIFFNEGGEDD